MADPWPVSLPPLPYPLSYTPRDGTIVTPNDAGPENVRPAVAKVGIDVSWQPRYTGAEWATLYAFWETTLVVGSLPFELEDPFDDVTKDWRFTAPPAATIIVGGVAPDDRQWLVSISALILPQ